MHISDNSIIVATLKMIMNSYFPEPVPGVGGTTFLLVDVKPTTTEVQSILQVLGLSCA